MEPYYEPQDDRLLLEMMDDEREKSERERFRIRGCSRHELEAHLAEARQLKGDA